MAKPFHERAAFVRAHTVLAAVPLTPEIVMHTATELTPLWQATETWLEERGLDVPFWCVPWAGGQALARWILDHHEIVRGLRVVDVGCGGGLVAIAAALAGAAQVTANDVDPLAEAASRLNAEQNGVSITTLLRDAVGNPLDCDVVLAGDVWYEHRTAERFGSWFEALARRGIRVLTADPGRRYAPGSPRAREIARFDVPTHVELESTASKLTRVLELV